MSAALDVFPDANSASEWRLPTATLRLQVTSGNPNIFTLFLHKIINQIIYYTVIVNLNFIYKISCLSINKRKR